MTKVVGTITLFLLMILIITDSQVSATIFTVTSNPLWTDTGITVSATDTVTFTNPTADWNWGQASEDFDSGGDYQYIYEFDEWIRNGQHGEMIGFIGNPSWDLNTFGGPNGGLNIFGRVIDQNDPRLFVIGSAHQTTISGLSGELWIGFNDDYFFNQIIDNINTGSVDITTSSVPLPSTLLLLSSGLLGLEGWRRIKRG